MTDVAQMLYEAMKTAQGPVAEGACTLATVTAISPTGGVTVQFDGETAASGRPYRAVGPAKVGDRVVMLRAGSTYVVAGAVLPQAGTNGAGGVVNIVYAATTQTQDLTFNHNLGWTPSAVQATPGDERFIVAVKGITGTTITLRSYYVLGAAAATFALAVGWHADR